MPTHLCLDFGTGYCKAAVCSPGQVPVPLAIGKAVRQGRGDAHMVRTALHVSRRGRVFFGEAAVDAAASEDRVPFDTLKEAFVAAENASDLEEPLPSAHNPTEQPITRRQAITLFLAFFSEAALHGFSTRDRDILRSVAMPVFVAPKADWVSRALADGLRQAHVLANRFGDSLFASIPLEKILGVLDAGGELAHVTADPPTVAEPVAAVAAHLLHLRRSDEGAPGLMLIVDVGAGTSDTAMFVKGHARGVVTFRHVAGSKRSLPKAGRAIDQALVAHLLDESGRSGTDRDRLEAELRREGRGQPIKEELFRSRHVVRGGARTFLDAFLRSEPLQEVAGEILGGIETMLHEVDPSFFSRQVAVRLSGGGAFLPFLNKLTGQRYVGEPGARRTPIDLVPTSRKPQWSNDARFTDLYGQVGPKFHRLAVALGGAYYGADARSWLRLDEDIPRLGVA